MIFGHVRDGIPFLSLSLTGLHGTLNVECVLDTGFDGELALPFDIIHRLECVYIGPRDIALADRTLRKVPAYEIRVPWLGEQRLIEAILLEGRPLIGGRMFDDSLIQIEMRSGGEVTIEPL